MAENQPSNLETISRLVQVVSVVAGVVISVLSFNQARSREAAASGLELEKRRIEASKPFLELRQKFYLEIIVAASVLASSDVHTEEERSKAKKRFLELYWGELSIVEDPRVETAMINMAWSLDLISRDGQDPNEKPSPQNASYQLSHAIRDSLFNSWGQPLPNTKNINP